MLFPGEDAIPTGGGVSFNVDFKPVKKSKRRRKIKKRAQTPMVPKVEEKEDVRIFPTSIDSTFVLYLRQPTGF